MLAEPRAELPRPGASEAPLQLDLALPGLFFLFDPRSDGTSCGAGGASLGGPDCPPVDLGLAETDPPRGQKRAVSLVFEAIGRSSTMLFRGWFGKRLVMMVRPKIILNLK